MTDQHIDNTDSSSLQNSINNVKRIYMQHGFNVVNILIDFHFVCIFRYLVVLQIHLNICSNNDLIGKIEHLNITIKYCTHGIYNTIPFQNVPGQMLVDIIALIILWLNAITPSSSIAGNLSPGNIFTGTTVDCIKHCRLQFIRYAQLHEAHNNTMKDAVIRSITLRPTGNA